MTADDDLPRPAAEIRALCDAATPGPWEAGDCWVYTLPIYDDDQRLSNVLGMTFMDAERRAAEIERGRANAEFIAASRELVPALLARVERLSADLAEARRERDAGTEKLAALREHTLSSNPALRQLHDAAVAYVDARNALADVRGGPLSTTIGYLIRAGYLVLAEPTVGDVSAFMKMTKRATDAEAERDAARVELGEQRQRAEAAERWRDDFRERAERAQEAAKRATSLDALFDALLEAQYGGMSPGADERESVAQLAEELQPLIRAALAASPSVPSEVKPDDWPAADECDCVPPGSLNEPGRHVCGRFGSPSPGRPTLAELQQRYLEVRGLTLSTVGLPGDEAIASQVEYVLDEARELVAAVGDLGNANTVTDELGRPLTSEELLTAVRHEIADVAITIVTLANLLDETVEACIDEKTEADRGRG